jgi:hypothetical protein
VILHDPQFDIVVNQLGIYIVAVEIKDDSVWGRHGKYTRYCIGVTRNQFYGIQQHYE